MGKLVRLVLRSYSTWVNDNDLYTPIIDLWVQFTNGDEQNFWIIWLF